MIALLSMLVASASADGVGLQAFHWRFQAIAASIPEFAARGYTHVQVSPPQKSLPIAGWWGLYQPVDLTRIEGPLGNERDFREMAAVARQFGVTILVDVVLNHMAGTASFPALEYPQFTAADFHYPDKRPCIRDWTSRWEVTRHWLCSGTNPQDGKGLPDLDTSSPKVRRIHREFLEKLLALGAGGFRLDAAKHIEPEYFEEVLRDLPGSPFIYGEVIGNSLAESNEYVPLMKVTDFHLLGEMLRVFDGGADFAELAAFQSITPSKAVVFARNHDTAMHDGFFEFGDKRDVPLAGAFVLAKGDSFPFVFIHDYLDRMTQAAVSFNRRMSGAASRVQGSGDLLRVERANEGLVLINKSREWMEGPVLSLSGLKDGCYRELAFDFPVRVKDAKAALWSTKGAKPSIGPKTALFLVPATDCGRL